jgi:hypothetical protein
MSDLSQRNYKLAGLLLLVFFAILFTSIVLAYVSTRPVLP